MAPIEGDLLQEAESQTTADEDHYEAHRADLLKLLHEGKGAFLRLERRREGGVGLMNQGATCYMNSLLQALFHIPEFRLALYSWSFDPALHGDPARCIPLQLQHLFAQLQLTRASAVSTRPLTAAFGFSDMESREQHDVQELCRVLFDALGRSSPALAEEIDRLYSGKAIRYVRSREAADDGAMPESHQDEKFLDLQVPIQGCRTLEEALQSLTEAEILDGGNQWFCEKLGRKVDALKGVDFGSLPRILCLQLLRFVFDVATMRRRKLTEEISIPLEADFGFMLGQDSGLVMYELTAVCCHSGTAHGGHYHALIRDVSGCRSWRDANDAVVRTIGPDQEATLFPRRRAQPAGGADGGPQAEAAQGPQALSSSDAYFLVYRRADQMAPEVTTESVPEATRCKLLEENSRLEALQRAYEVHRKLLDIRVFAPTAAHRALRKHATQQLRDMLTESEADDAAKSKDPQSVVLSMHESKSTMDLRHRAVNAFVAEAERGGETWPWSMQLGLDERGRAPRTRLRRYDWRTGEARAPLDDATTLGEALRATGEFGTSQVNMFLEVRATGGDFELYDERAVPVVVCRWDLVRSAIGLEPRDLVVLRLPPPEAEATPPPKVEGFQPTVGALRMAAARTFGVQDEATLALVPLTGRAAGRALTDDAATLSQALHEGCGAVGSGDIVCVEVVPRGGAPRGDGAELQCAALYERVMNTAHLGFNHPDRPEFTEEFNVSISKDATLLELKTSIARVLGMDAESLHLARAHKAPQFKDETKSVRMAGFSDGGHVFVGHGAPCGVDEFNLRVAFYGGGGAAVGAARARDAFSHPARGGASVQSLREALVEPLLRWAADLDESSPFPVDGLQWRRLRLRDGQAGKQFAILRDDRTLRSALLGISDGRQIAVQVLEHDEELTADDLILQLRPWRYLEGKLHAPTEFIFKRTRSLAELREELTTRFHGLLRRPAAGLEEVSADDGDGAGAGGDDEPNVPCQDWLEIVALPTVGPPLSVKRCATLRWADAPLSATAAEEVQRPISDFKDVRDGATLVVRSALAAASGPPGEPAAKAAASPKAGSAKAKAKAKPRGAPSVTIAGRPARERSLVIEVAHPECATPLPPE